MKFVHCDPNDFFPLLSDIEYFPKFFPIKIISTNKQDLSWGANLFLCSDGHKN